MHIITYVTAALNGCSLTSVSLFSLELKLQSAETVKECKLICPEDVGKRTASPRSVTSPRHWRRLHTPFM